MKKAISIRQPWAQLIIHGQNGNLKDVENRSWSTTHIGELYIHASKTLDEDAYFHFITQGVLLPAKELIPRGGIIGRVYQVDCVKNHRSPWAEKGMWHHVYRNPEPLPFYPMPGKLSIFEFDMED